MSIREKVEKLHNMNKELSHYDFYILFLFSYGNLTRNEERVIKNILKKSPMQKTICRIRSMIIQEKLDSTLSDQLRLFEL